MYIWELGVSFFSYSVMKLYYLFLEGVKNTPTKISRPDVRLHYRAAKLLCQLI